MHSQVVTIVSMTLQLSHSGTSRVDPRKSDDEGHDGAFELNRSGLSDTRGESLQCSRRSSSVTPH